MTERDALHARSLALIERLADGGRDDAARDALLVDLARFQARHVEPYARLVAARGGLPPGPVSLDAIPALPTDVFRFARVASFVEAEDVRVFRTSGTTQASRGAHPFRELSRYDAAARAGGRVALFPDVERIRIVVLAPQDTVSPDSSLSYMLARYVEWFGTSASSHAWRDGDLDVSALAAALEDAHDRREPVALLGTSFAFVHAQDRLGARRFASAPGSRAMFTGGFKGRARELEPDALRALIAALASLDPTHIVAEYGMTELSSQLWETTIAHPERPRALSAPGWVRATPVDPETLRPVPDGVVGVLRLDDCANVDTCACLQTADLAVRDADGLRLLGRMPGAVPRGCALALDEALGARSEP